jgi:DegV family protein with EDD domain
MLPERRKLVKIVTDRAADLTDEEIIKHEITVAPLFITFPEGTVDSAELTPDDFYRRLEAMQPELPSTAQPSEGIFTKLYEEIAVEGEEILSIHISSGLSGTLNAARLAAHNAVGRAVDVVDTLTLSGGERFQVLAAARLAGMGWKKTDIVKRLEEIRSATEVVFTLETLTYLARGGRIGRVQAMAGSLLKIKPIIHVDPRDGKYTNLARAFTIKRATDEISDYLTKRYQSEPVWVSVMHGQYAEKAQALADLLKEHLNIGKLEILRISPVLGVHTGPGIVGAAVMPLRLEAS